MKEMGPIKQFINCRILREHKIIKEDLWVRDGVILKPENIFFDERRKADVKIDCRGAIIAPGFIDIQINGNLYAYNILDVNIIIIDYFRWIWYRFHSKY